MTQFTHSPHFITLLAAILNACDAHKITKNVIHENDNVLTFTSYDESYSINCGKDQKIHILGAGKASAAMALAAEHVLGERIHGGIVAVKRGHCHALKKVMCVEAGHPIPDEDSEDAGRRLYEYALHCDENDIVICMLSGGASACAVYPFCDDDNGIHFTLEDKKLLSALLLASGASIDEINMVRKHFSRIKGGRFAEIIYPAKVINLIISDVIGNRIDTIASGMTVPDTSTFLDVENVFRKYDLWGKVSKHITSFVTQAANKHLYETPKPGNPVFDTSHSMILISNNHALLAARKAAETLGYNVTIAQTALQGEASVAAISVYDTLREHRSTSKPLCFIWGGETTVTIKGPGKGGRNQEAALAFICEACKNNDSLTGIHALFFATDGTDGPTDAAGAIVNAYVMKRIRNSTAEPQHYLNDNNSYPFLETHGALLRTGPTKTNVCDVWIFLLCPDEFQKK